MRPVRLALITFVLALGAAAPAAANTTLCRHQRGHTIFSHGPVRAYTTSSEAYGCLRGTTGRVALWPRGPERSGSVAHGAGDFVAVQAVLSNQYTYAQSLSLIDLVDGKSYSIASLDSPIPGSGPTQGEPPTPGPWPLEAFALGPGGRTARLYDTYGSGSTVTGEVLDVIGFHHFQRTLARTGPHAIDPSSLSYRGQTVSWTQNGVGRSAHI